MVKRNRVSVPMKVCLHLERQHRKADHCRISKLSDRIFIVYLNEL